MPRLTPPQLETIRREYGACGVTVLPLVEEIEASWADVALLRQANLDAHAATLEACRQRDEARRVLGLSLDAHTEEVRRSTALAVERDRLRADVGLVGEQLDLARQECDRLREVVTEAAARLGVMPCEVTGADGVKHSVVGVWQLLKAELGREGG